MAAALVGVLLAAAPLGLAARGQATRGVRYFAYGSNMSQADLDRWCDQHGFPRIRPRRVTVAVLRGYALSFDYFSASRNAGVADLVPTADGQVWGLLMEISEEERRAIRAKEGWPEVYEEATVSVERESGGVVGDVTTYLVKESLRLPEQVPTSREYLDIVIGAAREHHLPQSYIAELERIPTEP